MTEQIDELLGKKEYDKAFNVLVKTYSQKLYWHIRRMVLNHDDADDVLQNTFIKAWRGLPKFRQDATLYTWLYRIATNESIDFLKKKKTHLSFDDVAHAIESNLEADAFFDGDAIQLKLQKAIAALPEKQRIVFNLRYFDEMPYTQMSAVLETSAGALKASYHHAVKKIEKYFTKED